MLMLPGPWAQSPSTSRTSSDAFAIGGGIRVVDEIDCAAWIRGADVDGERAIRIDDQAVIELQTLLAHGR